MPSSVYANPPLAWFDCQVKPVVLSRGSGSAITITQDSVSLVGVVNLSPCSTVRHTVVSGPEEALHLADAYSSAGAALLDVGAQSSRYDAPIITVAEELRLLIPTVEALVRRGYLVCVETARGEVARRSIDVGAVLLNTTAGLDDAEMLTLLKQTAVPCIVTYVEGKSPHDVSTFSEEANKPVRIAERLRRRISELDQLGIKSTLADPGIGISYRGDYARYTDQQIGILRNLREFRALGRPIFLSVPRKNDLDRVIALATLALENGVNLLRFHDREVARIATFLGYIK